MKIILLAFGILLSIATSASADRGPNGHSPGLDAYQTQERHHYRRHSQHVKKRVRHVRKIDPVRIIATAADNITAPALGMFEKLESSIAQKWEKMQILPRKEDQVDRTAALLLDPSRMDRYKALEQETGVPAVLIAVMHYREADADFTKGLANGDPIKRKTRNVPRGIGPFATWEDSARWAIHHEGLDKVKDWTIEKVLFYAEKFNGWGYRNRGLPSAYVYAATTEYLGGKFVSDGHFRRNVRDQQLGVAPVIATMISIQPGLAVRQEVARLPDTHPAAKGYAIFASLEP